MSGARTGGEHPRSLADRLRSWPDERLAALLRARPDLARPAPQDSAQLATRAATSASVMTALAQLDTVELTVLDALVLLSTGGPVGEDDVVAVVNAEPEHTRTALTRLIDLALVWEASSGLRPLTTVADALAGGPPGAWQPSGCRPLVGITDLDTRLSALTAPARALLEHVDERGGHATTSARRVAVADAETPAEEVLAHGLLRPHPDGGFTLPGEVSLALRGGHITVEPVDRVPQIATTDRSATLIARTAAGTAFEAIRRVELLLDRWGHRPPLLLRSGGLGVRDLKAVTALLQIGADEAALLIEVAHAAGLVAPGVTADGEEAWLPTDGFDLWKSRTAAQRWTTLAGAWLQLPRAPGLVGAKDQAGKTRNALADQLGLPYTVETRTLTLQALAGLADGRTLATGTGVPSLVTFLQWQRPRRPHSRADLAAWTVAEARILGVLGLDGMPEHGRLLLTEDATAIAAELEPLLPGLVDHILLQADLTAVAPGPLEPELASDLHLLADMESHGGATVHRFSAASIRRGFDAGWSAGDIHELLARVSRTPVPQPLSYLVDDTARTFGRLRIGRTESFVRADDEGALTELLSHPQSASWGLRRLAPGVLISSTPLEVLLPRLQEAGLAPVVEAPDGSVHVVRSDEQRARSPRGRRASAVTAARTTAQVAGVVSAIRAGDRATAVRPGQPQRGPAQVLSLLREAAESGTEVLVGYLDAHGQSSDRIVFPRRLDGGRLTAYDARSDMDREFAVHRITHARTLTEADRP